MEIRNRKLNWEKLKDINRKIFSECEKKFKKNSIDFSEFLDAYNTIYDSEISFIDIQKDYLITQYRIFATAGLLLREFGLSDYPNEIEAKNNSTEK